jgi:carboxyl-terminal processing protease
VRLTQFNKNTTSELREIIRKLGGADEINGLVLDMRYNPGGLLTEAVNVANLFIDRGRIVTQEDKFGTIAEEHRATRGRAVLADVPLAMLVNGGSASASEIVAGALQDYGRAVVVGEQTFGKGSVQNIIPLRGTNPLGAFKLTTHYYKLPSGRSIHRSDDRARHEEGVTPNVVVEMLPEQISGWIEARRSADLAAFDANGNVILADEDRVDPNVMFEQGLDPQLETALILLRVQMAGADMVPAKDPLVNN